MGYFNTDTLSYAYSGDRLGMIMRLSGQMIPFTHDSFATKSHLREHNFGKLFVSCRRNEDKCGWQ